MKRCPHCQTASPKSAAVGNSNDKIKRVIPIKGDVSVCIVCGRFAMYVDKNTLRKATADEIKEFPTLAWLTQALIQSRTKHYPSSNQE